MPIYEFVCDYCGKELEEYLFYDECGKRMECSCGKDMRRRFSICSVSIPLTGKDKVLKTLSKEDGFDFHGGDKHRKRYEQTMAKGLNYQRPLEEKVFTGFGKGS